MNMNNLPNNFNHQFSSISLSGNIFFVSVQQVLQWNNIEDIETYISVQYMNKYLTLLDIYFSPSKYNLCRSLWYSNGILFWKENIFCTIYKKYLPFFIDIYFSRSKYIFVSVSLVFRRRRLQRQLMKSLSREEAPRNYLTT